ncbi:MAG: DUF2156 domain-containing protein [Mycobacteriaceae bacterium]
MTTTTAGGPPRDPGPAPAFPLGEPRLRRLPTLLRESPVTVGFVAVLWVLGAITGSLAHGPPPALMGTVAAGVRSLGHGHLWTPLTAAAFAPGLPSYFVGSVVVLLAGALAERRLGSLRFAVAALTTQVLGVLLALVVVRVILLVDAAWAHELSRFPAVGPTTLAVGVALVTSAGMGPLWRRRLRVGLLVLLATIMLYGGLLEDLIRFCCALTGLACGPAFHRVRGHQTRASRNTPLSGTRRESRVLVAIIVAASALGPMLAAFSPTAVGPLSVLRFLFTSTSLDAVTVRGICTDPTTAREVCRHLQRRLRYTGLGPAILSLLPALLLLVLADGLRRGRRAAWTAAVAMHVLLVGLGLLLLGQAVTRQPRDELATEALRHVHFVLALAIPLLGPLLVLVVLLSTSRLFDVAAPQHTYRAFLAKAVGFVAALAAFYVVAGLVLRSGFDQHVTASALVRDFPQRLVPPGYLGEFEPTFLPVSIPATVLFEWVGVGFWAALAVLALRSFLRPVLRDDHSAAEARALLVEHGGSHLSWMTTWPGNSRWFTADGEGFVAYRVRLGVAITTGDPVCAPHQLNQAVRGFADFATRNGWTPCFYSVTEAVRVCCAGLGWGGLQVAEETVLPLGGLAFTGRKFQDVRTALNNATKQGITAEWVSLPTAPAALREQIVAISQEWMAEKGLPEMGFTLGTLSEVDDPEVRCLVAVDAVGRVHGITSWLPVHAHGEVVGWTLDFMRRRRDGFKPVMEFLIASAALRCKSEGAIFLSLSGAPLARAGRGAAAAAGQDDAMQRLLELLGRSLEPIYGFRSLLAFKEKFQPEHTPLHLMYPDLATLPTIGHAIGRAYLPTLSLSESTALLRKYLDVGLGSTRHRRVGPVQVSGGSSAAQG